MSTQATVPTVEEQLLQRQSGITPWSEFAERALETAEPAKPEPSERIKEPSRMTQKERAEWRETGEAPTEKKRKESVGELKDPAQMTSEEREEWRSTGKWPINTGSSEKKPEPKSANELTPEERQHWKETGDWPLKETAEASPERQTIAPDVAPVKTPDRSSMTPEELRVQHEKNYTQFRDQHKADPELKQALGSVQLDQERGGVVLHALADLSADQRRDVAKELAKQPGLTAAMIKRGANGQYLATGEQVRDTINAIAQLSEARKRYPDADARIFPTVRAIMQDQKIPVAVKTMLNDSDVLLDLVYRLGSDPRELSKFMDTAKSNPGAVLRQIATTEAALRGELSTAKQSVEIAKQRMETAVTDARKRYSDADKKIFPALKTIIEDRGIPLAVKAMINDSDVLVDLVYVLGSDSKALSKFAALAKSNPAAAIRQLVTTEALVRDQVKGKGGKATPERGTDGKFQKNETTEPITRATRPTVEVGGRTSGPGDPLLAAVKSGDYRAAKEAMNREYLRSHS